jgi:hypothetical protein
MNIKTKLSARGSWSLYNGRDAIGRVELRQGRFVAINDKGRIIGRYATLNQALEVFSEQKATHKGK